MLQFGPECNYCKTKRKKGYRSLPCRDNGGRIKQQFQTLEGYLIFPSACLPDTVVPKGGLRAAPAQRIRV
ncbi:hypothetical protein AAFF_G00097880 [Aldrovandia affinis]|uniref:Uncharacterized protein n=1 Tax=Aldrovandia affinis TaxID=143900 RepID=A0AAD7RVJ0_9TELE|nr:hypothetical protein AAFF_G00097880 [Aldrovandia affinis]